MPSPLIILLDKGPSLFYHLKPCFKHFTDSLFVENNRYGQRFLGTAPAQNSVYIRSSR